MERKKILIVNNNLKVGGIQKALLNFLHVLSPDYDVDLLLFKNQGGLQDEVPSSVRIIEIKSAYKYLGISQGECKGFFQKLKRGIYAGMTKMFGFRFSAFWIGLTQNKLKETYDVAISYMHCAGKKAFYGGSAEFVLKHTKAKQKICFIHNDYLSSGTRCAYNDKIYQKFDKIACVSDSVKANFLKALPTLSDKAYMVRNVVLQDEIIAKANENPFEYDQSVINILTVARLGKEKGINRMISALGKSGKKNFHYYVVGGGPLFEQLQSQIVELGLLDRVTLLGEDTNPYRYMKNADLLAVPSYHEAAPVVFQEAMIIGLPVFTTKTSSAEEMVGNFGFVCENEDDEIEKTIKNLLDDPKQIVEKNKIIGLEYSFDKNKAKKEFEELIK